jgi:hypothetical protein
VEPLTRGLPPPDPRSLYPLSSTEFVEPPPKKIPGYATEYNSTFMCVYTAFHEIELERIAQATRSMHRIHVTSYSSLSQISCTEEHVTVNMIAG